MIKRLLDILISLIALIILFPLLLIITMIVIIDIGMPYLFIQKRPGLRAKLFKFIKFRTMRNTFDSKGSLLSDSKRLTKIGKYLRERSLDELPNLWNVLIGNMSIVGPRPLLIEYLALYNDKQSLRHEVKPGITGWAQINGRNSLSWEEKLEYDTWYVKNQSLWLDLKIIFSTIPLVILKSDIKHNNHATMYKFKGTNEKR